MKGRILSGFLLGLGALSLTLPNTAAQAQQTADCTILEGHLVVNTFDGFGFFSNSSISVNLSAHTILYHDVDINTDALLMEFGTGRMQSILASATGDIVSVELHDQSNNSTTVDRALFFSTLDHRNVFALGFMNATNIQSVELGATIDGGYETTVVPCTGAVGSSYNPRGSLGSQ